MSDSKDEKRLYGHVAGFPFVLNWRPKPPTPHDSLLKINRHMLRLSLAPVSVDLSAGCSSVKNQGGMGSCTAFASCAQMEYIAKSAQLLNPDDYFAERFFYYVERVDVDHGSASFDGGSSLTSATQAAKGYGCCLESTFPYNMNYSEKPPSSAYAEAKAYQVIEAARVDESSDKQTVLSDVKTMLQQGVPLVIGFTCYSSLMGSDVAKTGIVPAPGGNVIGGHAILLVGYDDSTRRLKFKNSWGANWGDHGYGYLPYDYILQGQASDFWAWFSEEWKENSVIDIRKPTPPQPTPVPPAPPQPTPVPPQPTPVPPTPVPPRPPSPPPKPKPTPPSSGPWVLPVPRSTQEAINRIANRLASISGPIS